MARKSYWQMQLEDQRRERKEDRIHKKIGKLFTGRKCPPTEYIIEHLREEGKKYVDYSGKVR